MDPIDRQEAINAFDKQFWSLFNIPICKEIRNAAKETIKSLPSVQPEITEEAVKEYCLKRGLCIVDRRKTGRWINAYPDIEPNPMLMYGICSVCGFGQSISNKLKYCPNCGAKMEGEGNGK